MILQGRNLSINMQPPTGDDVKLLHAELVQLDLAIAEDERIQALFGKSTHAAVLAFQQRYRLPQTGEVDDKTAAEINQQVDKLHPPQPEPQPHPEPQPEPNPQPQPGPTPGGGKGDGQAAFVVQGYVRRADGSPAPGLAVTAWDTDLPSLHRDEQLGDQQVTGEDGFYRIEYTAAMFARAEKPNADLRVEVREPNVPDGPPLAESEPRFNAQPLETVDLVLPSAGKDALSEFERLLGEIAPLLEQVQVADLTPDDIDFLTGETPIERRLLELLVTAHSHAVATDMHPAMFYGLMRQDLPTELTALLNQPAALQREALARSVAENIIPRTLGGEVDAAVSRLQELRIRFMLQPPGGQGPSPLSTLLSVALPSVEQQRSLLALSTSFQGEPEAFWSELRSKPGFEDQALVPRLQYTLQLNLLTGGNLPLVQALAADKDLYSTHDLVALNPADWQARIAAAGPAGVEQIPANIRGGTDEEKIANYAGSIVETLKAAFPTPYLAQAIAVQPAIDLAPVRQVLEINGEHKPDLRRPLPADLKWDGMAEGDRQKAEDALAALRRELNAFPQLDADTLLAGEGPFHNPIRAGVQTFLAAAPDFDFGKHNIDEYVTKNGETAFANLPPEQRDPVTEQLKAFQRVYQVVPRDDSIMALMGAGLHSATAIADVPPDLFVESFAEQVGGKLQARLIHENAGELRDRATLALGSVAQLTTEIFPRAIAFPPRETNAQSLAGPDGAQPPPAPHAAADAGPDGDIRGLYASLFGRLNLCRCEHCRSVYSPAAYLVDLLHFLDREDTWSAHWRRKPLDVLLARRPDLQHIALNCENTNTNIPYIDLVNEILESYIVLGSSHDGSVRNDRGFTSAELLANPQHVSDLAYTRLKSAVYPLTLPFDRNLATVRAYLGHLGTSRHAVMETFRRFDAAGSEMPAGPALEYLGFSPEEAELVGGAALLPEAAGDLPSDPEILTPSSYLGAYYGFANSSDADVGWTRLLASVETFLQRTGLQYEELVELLKTRFVNPAPSLSAPAAIILYSAAADCDLAARRLQRQDGGPLQLADWARLQRFIRLWRKLGWSIHDVDRSLTALRAEPGRLRDRSFLTDLGFAVRVKDELGLGLAETLSFWSNIDTHGDDRETRQAGSLYARLFLNPAVRTLAGSGDPFALDVGGADLRTTTARLSTLAPAVQAALRVTAADLPHLRALALTDGAEDPTVDLAALSALHRYAVLARGLRVSIKDLAVLRDFIADPFADPAATLRFVKRARKLLASRFSPAELAYLYLHESEPGRTAAPPAQDVTACLLAIRAGLHDLFETFGQADRLETRLRKVLGRVMDQARTDAVLRLLDRSAVYAAPLAARPGVSFPAPLAARITYDADAHMLRFTGPMTAVEQTQLRPLVDSNEYRAAIDDLYGQPRAFVERELGQFIASGEAVVQLIDNDAAALAGRQTFVFDRVFAYLSRSLVTQALAERVQLDSAAADRLLTAVMPSRAAPAAGKLLDDFLALRDGAWDARYFATADWTGPATPSIDPPVDFAGRMAWPAPALAPDGAFSVRWSGKLVAPAGESYTFIVRAAGSIDLKLSSGETPIGHIASSDPEVRVTMTLQGGVVYDLTLTYAHTSGPANVQLAWESRSMPRTVIAEDQLFPASAWANAYAGFVLLHKAAQLVNAFGMTDAEIAYLAAHGADFDGFDFGDLPLAPYPTAAARQAAARSHFNRWERLHDLFTFRSSLPHPERLLDVLAAAALPATTAEQISAHLTEAKAKLVEGAGWDRQAVDEATGPDGFNATLDFFKNERGLVRLAECLALARRIGVTPAQLFAWARSAPDSEQAQAVKNAVKARYAAAEWLAVAKALNDPLRERQRDALVAYVLAQTALPDTVRTALDLFEYFLIDVDMSSCQPTSRIKQAISSVQLFVQRCLMNLESQVSPALLPANQWQWMRSYRVWEANRKVFLYPENWIAPELRDVKSPFFQEMENELLQNDLTLETAEDAFLGYLEKLDEVARLDIRGMYWEHESELDLQTGERSGDNPQPDGWGDEYWRNPDLDPRERADILHVFGRTQGTPPIYYYRRLLNHAQWTPWEKVQADIEGSHLIPVVFNRRLYLFWPLFREATDPNQQPPQQGERARQPDKRLEIQLAWSEYKDSKWAAKKTTASKIIAAYVPENGRFRFFFTSQSADTLVISCQLADESVRLDGDGRILFGSSNHARAGEWRFDGCDSQTDAFTERGSEHLFTRGAGRSFVDGQAASVVPSLPEWPDNAGLWLLNFWTYGARRLLRMDVRPAHTTIRGAQILYSQQGGRDVDLLTVPFFYQDREHTYFVTPEQVADVAQQIEVLDYVTVNVGDWIPPLAPITGKRALAPLAVQSAPAPAPDSDAARQDTPPWDDAAMCVGDWSLPYRYPDAAPQPPTQRKLRFHTFFHPYVCDFVRKLKRRGVPGLLDLDLQKQSDFTRNGELPNGNRNLTRFKARYDPTEFVDLDYPKEDVDFDGGPYAQYNWELFFHAPLLIAVSLSKNQRFEEARQWFHYILDPTTSSIEPIPQRYWNVLPFYRNYLAPRNQISELLYLLSYRGADPETLRRKAAVEAQVAAWRNDPFNPHLIARMRITAYQKTVFMKYIDNLLTWGDQLFAQDTLESINQATQLYVLAYQLLGPRPKLVPPVAEPETATFCCLRGDLDRFSNALAATENSLSGRRCAPAVPAAPGLAGSASLGLTLYFCIPPNDMLLGYWDKVEDRLFKIRHCMNIEGLVRQLPLFEPPIDPALLVRARAAGLDLGRVLNDINASLPHYRFSVMLQKALELCGEVRSLGAALLSALEKSDAEALSLLRSTHEIHLLTYVQQVKEMQVTEVGYTIEGLERSKTVIEARLHYYQGLIQTGQRPGEREQLDNLQAAVVLQSIEAVHQYSAAVLYLIPQLKLGLPTTAGVTFGGQHAGAALQAFTSALGTTSSALMTQGTMAVTQANYERREEEWKHQLELAEKELDQLDKQLAAANVRKAIAAQELQNHELQIENARAVDEFMRSKFTNRELYDWMVAQTSTLYFQAYQLAYDLARRAERAYGFERGVQASNFVQFGHWDSLRKGLLAGERLALDLKRLETAYMDQNRRDYELTRHVSLVLHDPLALIALKAAGRCTVRLPEALFDADHPGHYMRRIKSVALTIPAVVGPYTSVNCTLRLLSDKTRITAARPDPYAEQLTDGPDDRFVANYAGQQSIAVSHAQNDSGMFELNFRDERYLPFEGAGVISDWLIELPPDCNAFDLNTITDVVLRINYTARDGGDSLRSEARRSLGLAAAAAPAQLSARPGRQRLFSLKHEFAVEWFQFLRSSPEQSMRFDLTPERFPFEVRGRTITVLAVDVFVIPQGGAGPIEGSVAISAPVGSSSGSPPTAGSSPSSLEPFGEMYRASLSLPANTHLSAPGVPADYTWSLSLGSRALADILLVYTYTVG